MPVVKRLDLGESLEAGQLPNSATIRFSVIGAYHSLDAINEVKTVFGPPGTAHPDDTAGNLKSSRYLASERLGAGSDRGWFVDVQFSPAGGEANFQAPPVTEPDYVTAEFSNVFKTIKAPYFFKSPLSFEQDGSIVNSFDWKEGVDEFTVTGIQLRVVVNVATTTQYNIGAFFVTQNQSSVIHTIEGVDFLYEGAVSSQVSFDVWQVTHTWYADPGNDAPPKTTSVPDSADIISSPKREPFQDYQKYRTDVMGPTTGPAYTPAIGVRDVYKKVPGGHNGLIGNPIGRLLAQ
jgi:hypothetical protein